MSHGSFESFFFVLSLLGCGVLSQKDTAQLPEHKEREVEVIITTPRNAFAIGEPIPVKVRITNRGQSSFFIPREITVLRGGISFLELNIADSEGEQSPKRVGHIYVARRDAEASSSNLSRSWVFLAPGYSYGRTLEIDGTVYDFLLKPGRYEISGNYYAQGIDALPSLKGELKTNSLSIEIIPKSK